MQVLFQIKLPAIVKKKEDHYLSSCPILDVHSQGDTEKQALEHLTEALRLFFTSCFERGILEEVMRNCGFEPMKGIAKSVPFPSRYKSIEVPLPFKISPSACHV